MTTENILQNQAIITLLKKLGMSKTEVKCYLASITLGSASISEIARSARINRVNAYGSVKNLLKHGLIEQEMTAKCRRIHAGPLETLQSLAQVKQKNATKLRWKIEDLIPQLRSIQPLYPNAPKVLFFEGGKEIWKELHERSLTAKPGSEILFLGEYTNIIAGNYDDAYYIPKRIKCGVSARVLNRLSDGTKQLKKRDKQEMRETRFLPTNVSFPCTILIYNNETAFLWGQDSNFEKTVGVVLQGNAVANVMRAVFEMAWQIAGTPTPKRTERKS